MEARNRAIASRSRASSPAPQSNGRSHRRDRSSGPAETRFPIQTSPTSATEGLRKAAVRQSREVPNRLDNSPVLDKHSVQHSALHHNNIKPAIPENGPAQRESGTNNLHNGDTPDVTSPSEWPERANGGFAEKRDSLTRGTRVPLRKGLSRGSLSGEVGRPVGVQLVDKPMDD